MSGCGYHKIRPQASSEWTSLTPVAYHTCSFLQLNEDVLMVIILILSRGSSGSSDNQCDVRALSETCKHMRELCVLPLFRSCTVKVKSPVTLEHLPPRSVWGHIKTLRFFNVRHHKELRNYITGHIIRSPSVPQQYTVDPELGNLFNPIVLDNQLRNMQNLRSVHIYGDRDGVYDISLDALAAILSVPHLRQLKLINHEVYPSPDGAFPDFGGLCGLSHLTSFIYEVRMADIPPKYPAHVARQALAAILPGLSSSLETLCLPSMYTPVETVSETPWPRLRGFIVRGKDLDPPPSSYTCLFAKMPNLRTLTLEIASPHAASRPIDHAALFPLPVLENLTLSHLESDDAIYAHLPATINSLTLQSWPSQVYDEHLSTGRFSLATWPLLSNGVSPLSSLMLRVLRSCSSVASYLTRLHVEYRADEHEAPLLRCISSAFPSLHELEVHRSCLQHAPEDPDWPVETFAPACTSLTKLRALYLHSAFKDYPKRRHIPMRKIYYTEGQHRSYAQGPLLGVATALASILPLSLETLAFLTPDNFWPRWAIYSVYDGADGQDRVARYEYHRLAEGGAGHSAEF